MLQSLLFRIYIPGIIGVECNISYKSIFWFFYFQLKTCVIFHTNQKQEVNVKFLYQFDKDYTSRASELDVQVEKLSKEKKDYVEEIKVNLLCL